MKTKSLVAFALCVAAASLAVAQQPVKKSPFAVSNAAQHFVLIRRMPDVLWLDAKTATMQVIRQLDRNPTLVGEGIVLVQDPAPGTVAPKQITLTLGWPKVVLTAPTNRLMVNDSMIFTVALDPPPPPKIQNVEYHLVFDNEDVVAAQATHRFTEARTYNVSAYAVIPGVLTTPRTTIAITAEAPPPPPPTPKLTLSASTMNPSANEVVTFQAALDPQPPSGSTYVFSWGDGTPDFATVSAEATHAFRAAGTYTVRAVAIIDGARVTGEPLVVSATAPPPTPGRKLPPSIPWRWIAAGIVVLLATLATSSHVRRRPAPSVPISIRSGLGSSEVAIENPERVRVGFTVRLRAGFRSEEGGSDA